MKILSAKDYNDMSRKAANILSAQVILKPDSVIGLATGSTPIGMYKQLIEWYKKDDLDFEQVTSVNLDEYVGLPLSHPESYYSFMHRVFFDEINIKPENTHLPNGLSDDITAECKRYEQLIEDIGGIDLQILGIGHNGHIGFNEPNDFFDRDTHMVELSQSTINANKRFFKDAEVPKSAITMGIRTIMQAQRLLVMVSGEAKAQILYEALFEKIAPQNQASILQLHKHVTVIADKPALSVISRYMDI